ncbi:MAG: carbohydrate kinase family protein [Erysipelotrichaceae bacterium]
MNNYLLMIAGSDIDSFYQVEEFPSASEVTMAIPLGKKVGGCVLNVAAVASSKAVRTKVIDYLKQDDEDTDLLIKTLKEKNVEVDDIQYGKDVVNGSCLIMQCQDEKCIYVIEPKRPFFIVDDKMRSLLNNASYIYSLMHTIMISFADYQPIIEAKKAGAKMIFDGSSQYNNPEEIEVLLSLADGLFINTKAYEKLCSKTGFDVKDKLLENGALFVCITDGSNGAYCYTQNETLFWQAYQVDVVDSTGAGDSFAGCFLACLSNNMSYKDCLKYASLSGAYCCRGFGGMAASVPLEKLDEFEQELGGNQ